MIGIGIDPGKVTGMMMVDYSEKHPPHQVLYASCAENEVIHTLEHFSRYLDGADGGFIVIERFVTREGKHGVDTTAIEVIGRIKDWAEANGYELVWQLPAEKEMASNDVLRRLGLWLKGKDQRHIMDGTRHIVVRLAKLKHMPTLKKGWPPE